MSGYTMEFVNEFLRAVRVLGDRINNNEMPWDVKSVRIEITTTNDVGQAIPPRILVRVFSDYYSFVIEASVDMKKRSLFRVENWHGEPSTDDPPPWVISVSDISDGIIRALDYHSRKNMEFVSPHFDVDWVEKRALLMVGSSFGSILFNYRACAWTYRFHTCVETTAYVYRDDVLERVENMTIPLYEEKEVKTPGA